MNLTPTEFRVYKMELYELNCECCCNGVYLNTTTKTVCTKGLQFPRCRGHAQGFKVVGEAGDY